MKKTAGRLKEIRKEMGLSQEKMSEIIGIKRSAYSKIELGENNMPEPHLIAFSQACGISLNWLLLGTGPKRIEDIGKIDYGEFTGGVQEMLDAMRNSVSTMHQMLAFYFRTKEQLERQDASSMPGAISSPDK